MNRGVSLDEEDSYENCWGLFQLIAGKHSHFSVCFYPFPFCLLLFSNKPSSAVTRFHEIHAFFMSSCLLSVLTNPARWSHQQVTEVHASGRSSELIVKFVSALSKHTRQEREAGQVRKRPTRGTDLPAITSGSRALTSRFLCELFSVSDEGQLIL